MGPYSHTAAAPAASPMANVPSAPGDPPVLSLQRRSLAGPAGLLALTLGVTGLSFGALAAMLVWRARAATDAAQQAVVGNLDLVPVARADDLVRWSALG